MKSVKLQSCWVRMGLTPVTGVLVRRGPEGLRGRKTCTCVSQLLQAPPGHALLVGGWPRHTVTTPPLGDPSAGPSRALREKHTEPKGHFTCIPGTGLPLTSQPRDLGEPGTEQCGWGTPGVGTALPGPHRARFPAPQRHAHSLLDPFYRRETGPRKDHLEPTMATPLAIIITARGYRTIILGPGRASTPA